MESRLKLAVYIQKCVPKGIQSIVLNKDLLIINLDREVLVDFLSFLRDHSLLRFSQLLDIWGVDHPERKERFEVNYLLLSLKLNTRVVVRVRANEQSIVDSVTELFSSAGWLEREVWDMFGVYFGNNADLRRILTDYGFEGHPLRKDFPLSGYVEVRYDESEKRVLQEPIEVQQEFRLFNFTSPWEASRD